MGSGIEPVGYSPFNLDPGRIQIPVLRALAELLRQQLPDELAQRFRASAGALGIAPLVCALALDPAARDQLGLAIEAALKAVTLQPLFWKRVGSDLCSEAISAPRGKR